MRDESQVLEVGDSLMDLLVRLVDTWDKLVMRYGWYLHGQFGNSAQCEICHGHFLATQFFTRGKRQF